MNNMNMLWRLIRGIPSREMQTLSLFRRRGPMRFQHFAAPTLRLGQRLYVIAVRCELRVNFPGYSRLPRGKAGTMDQPRQMTGHVDEFETFVQG